MSKRQTMAGLWLFPAWLLVGIAGCFFFPHWTTIGFLLYTLFRIYRTQLPFLQIRCLVFGLFFVCFMGWNGRPVKEDLNQIELLPDTIQVAGDQLQFTARRQKLFPVYYQLRTEAEQQWWQKQTAVLTLRLTGEFSLPRGRRNLEGFDYRNYQRLLGQPQQFSAETIEVQTQPSQRLSIHHWRARLLRHIREKLPAAVARWTNGLLFGAKDATFEPVLTRSKGLGIMHLFSLSGMHISILFGCLRYLLYRSGVTIERSAWLLSGIALLYLGLAGATISILRAVSQFVARELSRRFQWDWQALDCWSVAVIVGLLVRPGMLLTAAGQLSYGFSFLLAVEKSGSLLNQSLCLNLLLLPVLSYHFYEWQPLSILWTALLTPVFSLLLPLLLVHLCVPLPLFSAFLNQLCQFLERGLDWGQQLSFSWVMGRLSYPLTVGLLLLGIWCLLKPGRFKWLLLCWGTIFVLLQFPQDQIAFINVGQGASTFIRTQGKNILVDTGGRVSFQTEGWRQRPLKANAENTLLPYLKSQAVTHLDAVFITHRDTDHMGDLLTLAETTSIRQVFYPEGAQNEPKFQQVLLVLRKQGIAVQVLLASQQDSKSWLQVLHPFTAGTGANEDSLVVKLRVLDRNLLITGDLGQAGELELVKKYGRNLQADLLAAGHHGSRTSSHPQFLAAVAPRLAVISCGLNNRFGHPHPEVLNAMAAEKIPVWRTDQHGMVRLSETITGVVLERSQD